MPRTIRIEKVNGADRATLRPTSLRVLLSQDGQSIEVKASNDFEQRPGPVKTVTFEFLDDASRSLFEPPSVAEPFVLKPGESMTLQVKGSAGIARRPPAGAASARFSRRASGEIDERFTKTASFHLIDPEVGDDPDDQHVHVEC